MNGLVLGRFMPLHKGHCYLIDFAHAMCDILHICICSRHDDLIAGDLRCEWLKDRFPKAKVHHITKEISEANRNNPMAPRIWADEIAKYIMTDIHYFFASEYYGWDFARHLGAIFVPLDFERSNVHISATQICSVPLRYWDYLSFPVQRHVMMLIGVRGDIKYAERLTREFSAKLVFPYSLKKTSHMQPQLGIEQYKTILTAQINALHNFGYPLLFIYLEDKKENMTVWSDNDFDTNSDMRNAVCKKVCTIYTEEDYVQAHAYCNSLMQASWDELSL